MTNCQLCQRLRQPKSGQPACDAFPDGIPIEVWHQQRSHDVPLPGDGGLTFVHVVPECNTSEARAVRQQED